MKHKKPINHNQSNYTQRGKRHYLIGLIGISCLFNGVMADEDHTHKAGRISQDEAVLNDTRLLAGERGFTISEVQKSLAFQQRFSDFFADTLKQYPNQIARVWVEPAPYAEAHIQFVGKSPTIQAPEDVRIFGGGTYGFLEQQKRAEHLSDLLKANQYTNFMTYFDHRSGQIKLELKTDNHNKAISEDSLAALLMENNKQLKQDGDELLKSLSVADIDYEVIIGDGEIYDFDYARGGEWLTDGGSKECTSGWAVSGPNGNGIVTAAHCTGLDGLDHHYSTSDPTMTFRDQERGNGDVEYHTTSHAEVAEYYAQEDEVRDVTGLKWTILMFPGQSVCEYGRSDNVRSCNHDVIATGVTTTFTDGVTLSNLVRVTGDDSIGGDSGGPWSWGTVAWGVHSGSNGSTSLFTPVQRAQSELNVSILTK